MMEGLYRLKKGITQYAAEHEEGTYGALVYNTGSCFVVLIAALLYDRKFNAEKHSPVSSA